MLHHQDLLKQDGSLTDQQQKYCSCVMKVANKQSEDCLKSGAYGSGKCYNPYAVCAKNIGTTVRDCMKHYNYDNMTDSELVSLALLHHKYVPAPFNRQALINSLQL